MTVSKLVNKIILVVDDEADLRDIVASELEFMGAKVFTAENISVAKGILKENEIDLVISDIRMPGGTGIDLLEHIKSKHSIVLPVILITGFADITTEGAYALGAEALIHKPFRLDDLIQAAERFSQGPMGRFDEEVLRDGHHVVQAASQLRLGRGGVALELADRPINYEVGQTVTLDISPIRGSGVVRWVKSSADQAENTWIGVELMAVEEAGSVLIKEKLKSNTLPFIPSSQN